MGVRLIVQLTSEDPDRDRDRDENRLLNDGFRVYEINSDGFEDLIRNKTPIRLVGVEVFKEAPKPAVQPITVEVKPLIAQPVAAPTVAATPAPALQLPPPAPKSGIEALRARLRARTSVAWWKQPLVWVGLVKKPTRAATKPNPAAANGAKPLPLP